MIEKINAVGQTSLLKYHKEKCNPPLRNKRGKFILQWSLPRLKLQNQKSDKPEIHRKTQTGRGPYSTFTLAKLWSWKAVRAWQGRCLHHSTESELLGQRTTGSTNPPPRPILSDLISSCDLMLPLTPQFSLQLCVNLVLSMFATHHGELWKPHRFS